jgi:HSP20 family molecular chaperone IbpA
MTYLKELENGLAPRITSPFDILVRNFFDTETPFHPLHSVKLKHPVDVYEDAKGLHLEVACTGLTKEDVSINIEGDILRVSYEKENDNPTNREYYYSGIAKRSFNFGYKVNNKFNLSKVDAKMENGLLNITIPFSSHVVVEPKTITIK